MTSIDALTYPIGRFAMQNHTTQSEIKTNIKQFAQVPEQLKSLLEGVVDPNQFENTYRDGGWNVRQVVNHLVDSHLNSYIRFKLAATEDTPIVKPYSENVWARNADYNIPPLECMATLSHIHHRVVVLASEWNEEDWNRSFYHPGMKKVITLAQNIALYSWHGRHHLQHVKLALSKDI